MQDTGFMRSPAKSVKVQNLIEIEKMASGVLPDLGIAKFKTLNNAADVLSYANAFENFFKAGKVQPLTRGQAATFIRIARKHRVKVRFDKTGHQPPNPWTMPHINVGVGRGTRTPHIPVDLRKPKP